MAKLSVPEADVILDQEFRVLDQGFLQESSLELLRVNQVSAYNTYETLLNQDVARELARINLPLSTYTQWYWQIDLHNLFHFLNLRLDRHAQYEIREYAERISWTTILVAPITFEAFEEYVLGAARLPKSLVDRLHKLLNPHFPDKPMAMNVILV